jgi:hypothetical protein
LHDEQVGSLSQQQSGGSEPPPSSCSTFLLDLDPILIHLTMSSSSTLPNNDLMSPPKSGRFQLVVTAVAKSDADADTIHKMTLAIQKRALSDAEKDTHAVSHPSLQRRSSAHLSDHKVPSASIGRR